VGEGTATTWNTHEDNKVQTNHLPKRLLPFNPAVVFSWISCLAGTKQHLPAVLICCCLELCMV
jgi:hypothetical protein